MHDGGDGGDDEEENSFSDGRHRQAHPGEADSCHHGFLYFGITLFIINDCIICRCPADVPAAVTPAAKRNSYRVAGGAYRLRRILPIDYDGMGIRKGSYPGFPKKDGKLFAFCCNFVPINIYNDKKHYENWSFLFGQQQHRPRLLHGNRGDGAVDG